MFDAKVSKIVSENIPPRITAHTGFKVSRYLNLGIGFLVLGVREINQLNPTNSMTQYAELEMQYVEHRTWN